MDLQTNLKGIKESFDNDEKMLENAFRLERLWRKYRTFIIVLVLCIIGALIYWQVAQYLDSKRAQEASSAYDKLTQNAEDKEALQTLKQSSPQLYDLYQYFNAHGDRAVYEGLLDSQNDFVRLLAQYEMASLQAGAILEANEASKPNEDINALLQPLDSIKSANLKDLATLQAAYILFKANKIDQAHQKLMLIPQDSPLRNEATMLKHYGIDNKPSS
ncbi:tetratricopeptide repeat protein [Helicobacter jaachi]|uniref:Tetratricopeptide repeat protein n=1 Tax=Helicobacter jaachi TaxID=1677920 RepID=A0A4U8TC61_9HELI|nr:tetratricopeptide repeat protein [Helicobacter jaachi]TLD97515.1 tetratricopeptide repeat protein [Helicobacter jaachi]